MKVVQFPGGGSSSGGAGVSLPSRIAALDIGSTKICCLIGEVTGGKRRAVDERVPGVTIIGSGHCRSGGVRGGHVVDVREAERAVRVAIEQAERMSGATLQRGLCQPVRGAVQVGSRNRQHAGPVRPGVAGRYAPGHNGSTGAGGNQWHGRTACFGQPLPAG
jgi:hypothetical protein